MNLTPHLRNTIRGVFVGSGSDGMSDPRIANAILDLVLSSSLSIKSKSANLSPLSYVNVLYIGTATYDLSIFQKRQVQCFIDKGCTITSLDVALKEDIEASRKIEEADIIIVAGGNTLYAIDRWEKCGIIPYLREAMERGVVLSGGSAGAICWFDGGHSDSMDPDSYKIPMLQKFGCKSDMEKEVAPDESSTVGTDSKDWKYIRVAGLGFLPGLICPHHDKVQSNGVLRAYDFDKMLLKHKDERGIGIDHWAALIVSEGKYKVLSLEGKVGSVVIDEDNIAKFKAGHGIPGIWIKDVEDGKILTRLCLKEGNLIDLLKSATEIIQDESIEQCRLANPSG